MSSTNERVKASQEQINFLMRYMKENVCLSRPLKEKLFTAQELYEKWEFLSLSLNGIEGAKKSMQQWQKTWRDIQNSMKKRGLTNGQDTSTADEHTMDFDEQIEGLNIFVLDDSQSTDTQDMPEKTINVKPTCRAKLNSRQLDHLFHYMKRNSEMFQSSANRGLLVRAQLETRWDRLAQSLNDLGPPCKPVIKWKQTWRDLRNRLQKNRPKNEKVEEDNDSVEEKDELVKSKPRPKANRRQMARLFEYMKRHGGDLLVAASRPGESSWRKRMRLEAHWNQLTQILNNLGPPCKQMNNWRQTWRDFKRRYAIKYGIKKSLKEISMEDFNSHYIEENTNESIEQDSRPDMSAEGFFKEATEDSRGEDFEFNPIFADAHPIIEDTNEDISQHTITNIASTSKTESMQCLIDFEKESLDLRKRQIALEEKRIELKERKLLTEEAKVQALQRIAAALEQNNLNNFNRFNLT